MNANSRPGAVTWLGLAVVALAAAVLSFASLRHLAISCGTTATLAWLLPVCIDAAAVVATRVWLAASSPDPARRFARKLALGAFLLSVAGNAADHALSAYGIVPPWWAVVAVAAVPPAILAGTAHLAALVTSTSGQAGAEAGGQVAAASLVASGDASPAPADQPGGRVAGELAETLVDQEIHQPMAPVDQPGEPVARQVARARRAPGAPADGDLVDRAVDLVAAGEAEGRQVGRARLARELRITENRARQVLRQVAERRRPVLHAVGGDDR